MYQPNIVKKAIYFCTIMLCGLALCSCGIKSDNSNKAADTDIEANKVKEINKDVVKEAQQNTIKTVRAIDSTDHYKGDLKAPVQIIIYSDFECPFSAGFKDTIDEVWKNFSDKVVVAFRNYPLRTHAMAYPAALAGECASDQGKFWEMHDKLFQDNKDDRLTEEQFEIDANDLGLDMIKFKECLTMERDKDRIQSQLLEAVNFGVSGTPGVFVNGRSLPGAYPYEDFTSEDGKKKSGMKSIIEKLL